MKHYYAFDWTKGLGTYDMDSMLPIGVLHIFESSRDRDNYVSSNDDATELDASVAKKIMVRDVFRYSPKQYYFGFITEPYYLKNSTTDELVEEYRAIIGSKNGYVGGNK